MAWAEAYADKQGSMQGLIGQLQDKRQAEEENRSSGVGGLFKLLGGAALMIFSGGAAAPVAGAMMTGGIGMAGSGIGDIF